jgi:hypothetical protein
MKTALRVTPWICALTCSAALGCTGGISVPETEGSGDGDGAGVEVEAVRAGLRRLSQHEYDNTLRDLLRDEERPSGYFLPTDEKLPFDNNLEYQQASQALVEGLEFLASEAADRLLADVDRRAAVVGCTPQDAADADCFRSFVTTFGRRALRRPLADDEVADYMELQAYSVETDDFYTGVAMVVREMLQDPRLVYRVEIGTPVEGSPQLWRLDDWEVASRLSYLLWGSMPDDALFDRAQAGGLRTVDEVRAEAERMLAVPRALERIDRFHALWMGYEAIPHGEELTQAMRDETLALIRRVIFDDRRPWQDLFRLPETFIDDLLAEHYGLPAPGPDGPAWVPYGASGRGGLFSHGSYLSIGAKFNDTSPTIRGKAIRTRLLCQNIPPPPPIVDTDAPPEGEEGAVCKSDRYEQMAKSQCSGCHALMDPIGMGLEQFDSQGRFRATEPGLPECPISGNGEIVGVGTFRGPGELGELLTSAPEVNACAVRQLYRFAMGRNELDDIDERLLASLGEDLGTADFRFDELLLSIVADPSFGHRLEEQ